MPINIPNELPAKEILESEKIFAIDDENARRQRIRPLRVVILNLMPKKIETETQILRLLSKSPLQLDIDLMKVSSHESKNTSKDHLVKFYENWDQLKENFYDCMIITGVPVEEMPFEEVDYWEELTHIFDWTKTHVLSTMHICWGAQAGLYYHYGIHKYQLKEKLFGIFPHELCDEYDFLTNGFDEIHNVPHSRHTKIDENELAKEDRLVVLSRSKKAGSTIIVTKGYRQVFVMGHFEYGVETLAQEYFRDVNAGKPIHVPENYFPNDDPHQRPILTWRSHANLLYRNWLNYVYQTTPYHIEKIKKVPLYQGFREDHGYAQAFRKEDDE